MSGPTATAKTATTPVWCPLLDRSPSATLIVTPFGSAVSTGRPATARGSSAGREPGFPNLALVRGALVVQNIIERQRSARHRYSDSGGPAESSGGLAKRVARI